MKTSAAVPCGQESKRQKAGGSDRVAPPPKRRKTEGGGKGKDLAPEPHIANVIKHMTKTGRRSEVGKKEPPDHGRGV